MRPRSIAVIVFLASTASLLGCIDEQEMPEPARSSEARIDEGSRFLHRTAEVDGTGVTVYLTLDRATRGWEAEIWRSGGTTTNVIALEKSYWADDPMSETWNETEYYRSEAWDFPPDEWLAVHTVLESLSSQPGELPPPLPANDPFLARPITDHAKLGLLNGCIPAGGGGPVNRLPPIPQNRLPAAPVPAAPSPPPNGGPAPGTPGGGAWNGLLYLFAFQAGWQVGTQLGAGTPPRPVPAVTSVTPRNPSVGPGVGTARTFSLTELRKMQR